MASLGVQCLAHQVIVNLSRSQVHPPVRSFILKMNRKSLDDPLITAYSLSRSRSGGRCTWSGLAVMEHGVSRIHRNPDGGGFGDFGSTLPKWNEHPWTDEQVKAVLEAFESGRKPSIRAYLWILCNLRCEEAARLRVQLISDFRKMKQGDDGAAQSDERPALSASGMKTPIAAPANRSSGAKGASTMVRHSALLRRPTSGYRVSSAPRARQYGLQSPRLGRADGSGLKNPVKANTPALMTRRILSMLDDAASPMPQSPVRKWCS